MNFEEVKRDDFVTFTRQQPSYVKMEQTLVEVGGHGVKGVEFKKSVLSAAGWNYGALISYGAHPDKATEVFNQIRVAMADLETEITEEDLMDRLKPAE